MVCEGPYSPAFICDSFAVIVVGDQPGRIQGTRSAPVPPSSEARDSTVFKLE
jgi:hypothetical protein